MLYMGTQAGKEIYDKIKSANKSIRIITPYLSDEYIDLLKEKEQQGVKVFLIVSTDLSSKKKRKGSFKKLINQLKETDSNKRNIKIITLLSAVILTFISGFVFYKNKLTPISIGAAAFAVLLYQICGKIKFYKYSYETNFTTNIAQSPYSENGKSSDTLVHSKLYIIDDEIAYTGSMNFTLAGFWKNHEIRVTLTKKEDVDLLMEEFATLFNSDEILSYVNPAQIGEKVYKKI